MTLLVAALCLAPLLQVALVLLLLPAPGQPITAHQPQFVTGKRSALDRLSGPAPNHMPALSHGSQYAQPCCSSGGVVTVGIVLLRESVISFTYLPARQLMSHLALVGAL